MKLAAVAFAAAAFARDAPHTPRSTPSRASQEAAGSVSPRVAGRWTVTITPATPLPRAPSRCARASVPTIAALPLFFPFTDSARDNGQRNRTACSTGTANRSFDHASLPARTHSSAAPPPASSPAASSGPRDLLRELRLGAPRVVWLRASVIAARIQRSECKSKWRGCCLRSPFVLTEKIYVPFSSHSPTQSVRR